jgi:hypothetical protein
LYASFRKTLSPRMLAVAFYTLGLMAPALSLHRLLG